MCKIEKATFKQLFIKNSNLFPPTNSESVSIKTSKSFSMINLSALTFNPFVPNATFLYPRFSVFREKRKGALGTNGLISLRLIKPLFFFQVNKRPIDNHTLKIGKEKTALITIDDELNVFKVTNMEI